MCLGFNFSDKKNIIDKFSTLCSKQTNKQTNKPRKQGRKKLQVIVLYWQWKIQTISDVRYTTIILLKIIILLCC